METLLNDLSCMIGNPLLSDVEIVAKDNMKFCAHSFMLSARCATLAEVGSVFGEVRKSYPHRDFLPKCMTGNSTTCSRFFSVSKCL